MKAIYKQKFEISDEERRLFRMAVRDIEPIAPPSPKQKISGKQAFIEKKPYPYPLSDQYPEPVGENDVIEYASSGGHLSHKLQKEIKREGLAIEIVVDLHGYALEEACYELSLSIKEAYESQSRRLLIIHGKGQHGLLKRYTAHWLKQMPPVMYFCSALPKHGGTGALYVLLKKEAR